MFLLSKTNRLFTEIKKNSKTTCNKDGFYKAIDLPRNVKKIGELYLKQQSDLKGSEKNPRLSASKALDQKNKISSYKEDIQNKLKSFGLDNFLRVTHERPSIQPKKEIPKAKLVSNVGGRPSSAPIKDEKKDSLIQKHLLFDGPNNQASGLKLGSFALNNHMISSKIPANFGKDYFGGVKSRVSRIN